jgi:hypothetical protein
MTYHFLLYRGSPNTWLSLHVVAVASSACLVGFLLIFAYFWFSDRRPFVYFDPADLHHHGHGGGRDLPVSAGNTTFEPMLGHYVGAVKLLVTVAAASVAFGSTANDSEYRYDEYTQDVHSYTRFWYSTVESLGFAALGCFCIGYFFWAFQL